MASGQARARAWGDASAYPVHVLGVDGKPRWHDVWAGVRWIAPPAQPANGRVLNGPRCRPYIESYTAERYTWRAYQPARGEIVLTGAERNWAKARTPGRFALIEPHVKATAYNKRWPLERWQAVVDARPDLRWLQCVLHEAGALRGVTYLHTPGFRWAAAILARAAAYVGHEGGRLNLSATDHLGQHFAIQGVVLVQEGEEPPPHGIAYAHWMPYQVGQAAKTEEAEARAEANHKSKR
jgi:hypothetical protein